MAEIENVTVLKVDGTQAATTLKELKAEIAAYKDALVALGNVEEGDTEKKAQQAQIIDALVKDQRLLNDVMGAGKGQTLQEAKAVDTATASYADMQKALTALRRSMKEMSAQERQGAVGVETGNRIRVLDAELKRLDGEMGVYTRNVGNYGQTFAESLSQAQAGASSLMSGMSGLMGILSATGEQSEELTGAFNVMRSAFVALTIGKGIGDLITKGGDAIKMLTGLRAATQAQTTATTALSGAEAGTAAATGAATTAMSAFRKALIATGIGAAVVALGLLIANLDKVAALFGHVSKEARKALEDEKKAIDDTAAALEQKREILKAGGAVSEEVMAQELRDLQALTSSYEEHYRAVLSTMGRKSEETKAAMEAMKEAQTEFNNALDAARVSVEAFAATAELQKAQRGMSALEKEEDKVRRQAAAAKDALLEMYLQGKVTAEELADLTRRVNEAQATYIEEAQRKDRESRAQAYAAAKKSAQQIADAAADGLRTEEERLTAKYQRDLAQLERYHIDTTALTQKYEADLAAIRQKGADAAAAEWDKVLAQIVADTDAMLKEMDAEDKAAGDAAKKRLDRQQTFIDREERLRLAANELTDQSDREREQSAYDIQHEAAERRLALLRQMADEAEQAGRGDEALALQAQAADQSVAITEMEAQRKAEIRKRDKENAKTAASDTVKATSSILGAIADIYEATGKDDERMQRKAKNLRIAAAVIDTLQGAVTAYASAQSLGLPLGPIIGGINAAAVTAMGVANVAKIRKTDTSGTSDPSGALTGGAATAAVAAPVVTMEVPQVRNVTGASEEQRLDAMAAPQKVYILESDIEAAGCASRVRVQESSFGG
jgi:hypothetical protein